MAELNKAALTSENNNSFPNNNTGFITPTLLREFNQDMIDSMVDEISYNSDSASFNTRINAITASGGTTNTGSLLLTASAVNNVITFTKGDGSTFPITVATGSGGSVPAGTVSSSAQIAEFGYATTSSVSQSVQSLNSATSSYITSAQTASMSVLSSSYAVTASFALNSTTIDTGSFATTGSNTFRGNQIISGNIEVSGNISLQQGFDLLTHHVQAPAVNGVEIQNNAGNAVALFGAGGSQGTTFYGQINTTAISSSGNITGNLLGTASFATTASFALNGGGGSVNTGSFATTASNNFVGTQNITGSVFITGSTFNAKVEAPALSVGVTTLDTLFESTQSGVPSQIDITRLGAGATGDLTGVRLQTLSGSDTTGDTLLSRISTGVNRHTSTAMTGSVVNTTILSQWATGSAGGRVTYGSTIVANAQSASATLTLQAGTGATLAGGTASLAAGLIRLGSNSAQRIAPTGSFTNITIDTGNNALTGFTMLSGSFAITTPQGSGSFYSNLPITSSNGRINGYLIAKNLIISGTEAGSPADTSGSLWVENNTTTNTLNVIATASFSGSVYGEVRNATVTSNTASVDLTADNFWQLQLTGSTNTFLNIQPVRPGQTVNIKVNTTGSGNVLFPSYVKQASGSAYTASSGTGVDIITLVSFDSTNIFLASIKNLI